MSDFIHRTTKQIILSGNDPEYRSIDWIRLNEKVLPQCDKMFWKIVGDEIKEMNQTEKYSVIESRKRYKTSDAIMNEIFNNPIVGGIKSTDLLDDFPSFNVAISKNNIQAGLLILDKALQREKITLEDYNILKSIVTEKI